MESLEGTIASKPSSSTPVFCVDLEQELSISLVPPTLLTETLEESARVDLLKKQCLEKNAVVVLEKLPITSAQQPQFTSAMKQLLRPSPETLKKECLERTCEVQVEKLQGTVLKQVRTSKLKASMTAEPLSKKAHQARDSSVLSTANLKRHTEKIGDQSVMQVLSSSSSTETNWSKFWASRKKKRRTSSESGISLLAVDDIFSDRSDVSSPKKKRKSKKAKTTKPVVDSSKPGMKSASRSQAPNSHRSQAIKSLPKTSNPVEVSVLSDDSDDDVIILGVFPTTHNSIKSTKKKSRTLLKKTKASKTATNSNRKSKDAKTCKNCQKSAVSDGVKVISKKIVKKRKVKNSIKASANSQNKLTTELLTESTLQNIDKTHPESHLDANHTLIHDPTTASNMDSKRCGNDVPDSLNPHQNTVISDSVIRAPSTQSLNDGLDSQVDLTSRESLISAPMCVDILSDSDQNNLLSNGLTVQLNTSHSELNNSAQMGSREGTALLPPVDQQDNSYLDMPDINALINNVPNLDILSSTVGSYSVDSHDVNNPPISSNEELFHVDSNNDLEFANMDHLNKLIDGQIETVLRALSPPPESQNGPLDKNAEDLIGNMHLFSQLLAPEGNRKTFMSSRSLKSGQGRHQKRFPLTSEMNSPSSNNTLEDALRLEKILDRQIVDQEQTLTQEKLQLESLCGKGRHTKSISISQVGPISETLSNTALEEPPAIASTSHHCTNEVNQTPVSEGYLLEEALQLEALIDRQTQSREAYLAVAEEKLQVQKSLLPDPMIDQLQQEIAQVLMKIREVDEQAQKLQQ